MRRALLLLLACACSRKTIELPELGDAKSVLLLLEDREQVEAHELSAPDRRVPVDDEGSLTVLLYGDDLASLGLEDGTLARHEGEGGRALPDPDRTFAAEVLGEWTETLADQSPLFQSFRLAPEDPAQCVARGGCYPTDDPHCVRPCPSPAPPQPPNVAPAPVLTPCSAGWTEVDREAVTICEPRPEQPATPSCAVGTHPFLGGACRAIGPACPVDGWPVPPGGRPVIWIRAGENGAGTRDDPLGTIADGIAIAPLGAVLALAAGRHAEAVSLSGQELLGACSETIVQGAIDATAGVIRSLTVDGVVRVSGALIVEESAVNGGIEVVSGSLEATRVVSFVSAEPNARVTITDSVLDAPVAASFTSASATVTGTLLFGETRVMGGRLHLANDELHRRGGAALVASDAADVIAEQVVIRGEGDTAILSSASVTIRRSALLLAGAPGNGISASLGVVVANELYLEGPEESAFSVESSNLLVTGSLVRGGKRAVSAREGAEIHVDTTIVEDTTDFAFRIDGQVARPGETYQLEDLELRRTRGGARILRPQIGRLSRVRMIEMLGPGIYGEGEPNVVVEDLSVATVSLDCDGAASDCGALAASGGSLDVDRFEISNSNVAAVRLTPEGGARLANGRIVRGPIGVAAFGARDPRGLLRGVIFEEVGAACDPCGE